MATTFDFLTFSGINALFVSISFIGLILLLLLNWDNSPAFSWSHLFLLLFFVYLAIISILNFATSRWTSLAYSGFFITTYAFYNPYLQQRISTLVFRRFLQIVFYAFFIGLIAGQLHVYFGLFTPLSGTIGFMRGGFGTILEKGGIRFFSLSTEPSYAAIIVIIVFYTYVKLGTEKFIWRSQEVLLMLIVLIYMVFMFKSAYGVILLGLLFFEFVSLPVAIVVVGASILGIASIVALEDYDIKSVNRVINIVQKFDFRDPHSLFAADFTAYYRVAPILHYLDTFDWSSWNFILGHGASASRHFVVPQIFSAYVGGEFLGGFLPAFFYDFGLIGGFLILVFAFTRSPSILSFPTAAIGLMLLNANFNTQLFWFLLTCFAILKHKYREQSNIETEYVKSTIIT